MLANISLNKKSIHPPCSQTVEHASLMAQSASSLVGYFFFRNKNIKCDKKIIYFCMQKMC